MKIRCIAHEKRQGRQHHDTRTGGQTPALSSRSDKRSIDAVSHGAAGRKEFALSRTSEHQLSNVGVGLPVLRNDCRLGSIV
jgi:hypothetical protein